MQFRIVPALAGTLGGFVLFAVAMAMSNHIWYGKLKDFQTLAGGLVIIVAALIAHDAQSSVTREARRKDEGERESLRKNLCLKMEHAALMVEQRASQHLQDTADGTDNWNKKTIPTTTLEKMYSIALPAQIAEAWDHLSIVPVDACSELRRLTWHLDALAGLIKAFENAPIDHEISWKRLAGLLRDIHIYAKSLYGIMGDHNIGKEGSGLTLRRLKESRLKAGMTENPPYPPQEKEGGKSS